MAKGRVSGGTPLNIKANLDINQAKKNAFALIKTLNDIKTAASSSGMNPTTGVAKIYDVKPLSEYQAGLLKIKQEALDLAKQNTAKAEERRSQLDAEKKAAQEKASAEKSASLAVQAALKEETRLRREQIALQKQTAAEANKKKPTQVSNPQAEIDAYNRAAQGSNLYTSAINAQVVARAKLNAEAARTAVANGTLTTETTRYTAATGQQTEAVNRVVLSKKQLAQMLAEEKLRQADSTKELKNNAREMLNAKGSIEQRKAALDRLVLAYKRMSEAERNSASGQRMNTIIKDLGAQINKLDPTKVEKVAAQLKKVPESLPAPSDGGLFSKLFSSIGEGALSILGPLAAVGTVWTAVKNIFTHNVEISDTFADVRRTAKLSNDEVDTLAKGLKGLNTRTNLDGLLDVGFIGGRLGAAKKDLPEFIKQVDELAVVLKKELPGGAEAVSEALGSIVSVYKVTQSEGVSLGTALSKVGSNLLELAHSGPVTVKYLQDFTLGVAGTAASAKLSIPVISAYGAVLGEAKQIASSAALSITRLVTGLTTKTGKYAAIAQLADSTLTVEKFTKIVNTDTKLALDLFFKGLKSGNPVATEFAARLGSVGINTGKVTNAVKILAENQDKLADRIAKGTAAFEEGTSVAHNFEIANDTIGASVDKLGNSIVNLTTDPNSNMTNFFKGVIDGAAKGVSGLSIFIDTVKGLSTDPIKFVGDSAKKSRDESLGKLNEEARRYAQYSFRDKDTDAERLNILKEEVKIRDIINIQYLKAKVAYYNIRPQDRSLADTNKFNDVETKLQKQVALVRELNKLRNKKSVDITGTGELADLDKDVRTTDVIKAEIKDLELANKKLDVQSEVFKSNVRQIVKLRKELKQALGGKDTDAAGEENRLKTAYGRAKSLSTEIIELQRSSVRKSKSSDQEELDSVTDKYQKMEEKVKAFYANTENRGAKIQIDGKKYSKDQAIGLIKANSKIENDAVQAKQKAKKQLEELDIEKKQYEEYEKYKSEFGQQAANKQYEKLISSYKTYLAHLDDEIKKITDIPETDRTGAQIDQLPELNKRKTETVDQEKQKNSELLLELRSFNELKLAATDRYYADLAKLGKNATAQQINDLHDAYAKDIDNYADTAFAKTDIAKRLSEEVLVLTRSQIKEQIKALVDGYSGKEIPASVGKVIENLKSRLSLGSDQANLDEYKVREQDIIAAMNAEADKASPKFNGLIKQLAEIRKLIKGVNSSGDGKANTGLKKFLSDLGGNGDNAIAKGAAVSLGYASDAVGVLGDSLQDTNAEAAYTLDTIAKLGGAAADLGTAIISGKPDQIISASIKAIGTLFSIGKKTREMNAAARKEVAEYYSNAIAGEREYQDLLANRQLENVRNNKILLQGIRDEVALRKSQIASYKKESDEIMSKLQDQSYVSGKSYTHGTWLKKASTNPIYSTLAGKSFAELSQLLSQGKLEGDAKALVERLKELEQKGYDAEKAIADLAKQTSELFTGTTTDNLTNTLSDMFKSGKTSAKDLADFFKQSMDDAALSIFKNKVLSGAIENFYKEFDAAAQSDNELSASEIARLNGLFTTLTTDALKKFEEFKKITGSDLKGSSDNTGGSSSVGAIRAELTEQTGGKLEGLWRGQYDLTKTLVGLSTERNAILIPMAKSLGDFYQLAVERFRVEVRIEANTLRTADNTEPLKGMSKQLDQIITNTKGGPSARGAGYQSL